MAFKVAIAVFGLVAIARAGPIQENKIVGGSNTDITQVPYQVALVSSGPFVHCGGSIINKNTILTAGHCANTDYKVRVGATKYSDPNNILDVSEVIVHPQYSFPYNDVAIFKLAKPLNFTDSIQPIPLANKAPAANSLALASGWGLTTDDGEQPDILQSITLPITDDEWCKDSYGLDESVICAGPRKPDQGTCNGDSGGPLVVKGELVGVTSFVSSAGCALQYLPSGFASVAYLRDWIESQM